MFFIVSIQIIGKHPDRAFGQCLTQLLAHTPYRMFTSERPIGSVKACDTVYLFLDSCKHAVLPPSGKNTVAVVNAENTGILHTLIESGIHTIPCGLSAHNTFTLASSTEESTVISLQRSIVSLTGETADPMEIPVCHLFSQRFSRYQLMAICAVGCVTGNAAKLTCFFREEPV